MKKPIFNLILILLGLLAVLAAQAQTVTSDKPDYAPRSTAIFTGADFAPGETVTLKVKNLNYPCGTVSADSSYLAWTAPTDALGGFTTSWTVCDCPGDSLRLKATGMTSGLIAYAYFTDAGSWTYGPGSSGTISLTPGQTDNSTISINLTAPGNNQTFNGTLTFAVANGSAAITIGPGSNQIQLSTVVKEFNTGTSGGPGGGNSTSDPEIFPITISVGSAVVAATYIFTVTGNELAPCCNQGISDGSKWELTVNVGNTGGSISSVSIGGQNGSSTYGSASSPTYNVTSTRGANGNVNGTYSVSGLPPGVTGSFSITSFTSTGSNAFPGTVLTLSVPNNLNAGVYNFDVFLGDGNSQATSQGTLTVGKAATTTLVTINGGPFTYTGLAQTPATVSVTGAGGLNLTPAAIYSNNVNAGGATASYSYDGDDNYLASSDSKNFTIDKADATISVSGTTVIYDGNPHGAIGTATGVNDEALVGLDLGSSFTNVPGGTANWTFTDVTGNYNDDAGSVEIVIEKADATISVSGTTVTYDGNPHGATGSATGVNDETLSGLDLGSSFTNVPGGTANWTFTDVTGNYNDDAGSVEIVIEKADATISVSGTTVTYDGNPHGATGSATGVNDETLSGLDLGSSFTNVPGGTANWTFTDVTGNYNDDAGSVEIVIEKADATISVSGTTVTYDGNPHGATGSATGVNDETLSGLDLGSSFTNVPGGTANWTFTDVTGNYNDDAGSVEIVIEKADATISVSGTTVTYDGNPHGATGTATGVNDEALAGLDLGSSFTNVPGGTANWTFTDVTGNYNDDAGSVEIVIEKADATISVSGTTVTYDGNPHGATGSATGVNDETLSGLDLGSSFTNVPGGTANWTFTDVTGNYNDDAGSVEIVIEKANATISVSGTTVTYDGNPHGAIGTATGVNDEALAGLDLGLSFTNVPGGTANWTFTDVTGNYNDDAGSVEIVIEKADAIISVSGTTVTYDGNPHGATGTATGVNDEALAGLDLGSSFTNVPGGTANWTFTDVTGNYNDDAGSVEIVIEKADAIISVSGTTVTYDGNPHGATGTATGVNDEALAGLDLGSSFTNVPGGTANWTFTDVTGNYNNISGSVAIDISKADQTITWAAPAPITYGTALSATQLNATVTGVLGGTAPGALAYTPAAGVVLNAGTNTLSVSAAATNNYNGATKTVQIVVDKAILTVTALPASKYCGGSNPASNKLGYTVDQSDFVNGDTESVIIGNATYLISGTTISITGGLSAANYHFEYVDGILTIIPVSVIAETLDPIKWTSNSTSVTVTLKATVTPDEQSAFFDGSETIAVVFSIDGTVVGTGYTGVDGIANVVVTRTFAVDVYKITAQVTNCGTPSNSYLAVYDPNGGFVTGGGWINSPAGAYYANPSLEGRANFGFVSKYKKGSNVPEGNTEFQFKAGDLNFSSTNYAESSLVVAATKAIYKGAGTINGVSGYSFMVSALDGQTTGGGGFDKFRIKIWNTASGTMIYDNNVGAADNADPTTALAGGSIMIHAVKTTGKAAREDVVVIDEISLEHLSVYPNPIEETVHVTFTTPAKTPINFNIVDSNGRSLLVKDEALNQEGKYEIHVGDLNLRAGLYVLRVAQGTQLKTIKLLKK